MTRRRTVADLVADVMTDGLERLGRGERPAPTMARHLGEWFHADFMAYGGIDPVDGMVELRTWPDTVDVAVLADATRRIPHTHPLLRHWLDGHRDAAAISALVRDGHEWRHSEAYSVLRSTLGCTECAGVRLDQSSHAVRMLTMARDRDFSCDEVAILELVRRPLTALEAHANRSLRHRANDPDGWDSLVARAGEAGLTTREVELLELLAQGLLASTIATRMVISVRTVHKHLGNIYAKLGTHDRLSAVMRAQALGLVPGGCAPRHTP